MAFLKGTEVKVFGQSVTFIQKSRSFKSPKINIIDIIVDVLLLI